MQVYQWTGANRNVQYVSGNITELALGGGPAEDDEGPSDVVIKGAIDNGSQDWGFALALNEDLSRGTSSYSTTFGNPSFGDVFEIANAEVWTLSPVEDLDQAVHLELTRQFVFDHGNFLEQ